LAPQVQQTQRRHFLLTVHLVPEVLEGQQALLDQTGLANLYHLVILAVRETLTLQTIPMGQMVR